jgi:hypothetical protein
MLNALGHLEEDRKRRNIVIFGLEEKGKERYVNALEVTKRGLEENVRLAILVSTCNNDHIASLQEEKASSLYL